jgi:uncharacterized repeat protein (TIGR01451 family)
MSRAVRAGERIRFRLTVTNVGSVAARNVRMADIPPATLTLSRLRASSRASIFKGNAIWRFGTLAPGASRTVRGSVLVESGTPGLQRNHVLATAVNARLVIDRADGRLLRQRRTPAVTG